MEQAGKLRLIAGRGRPSRRCLGDAAVFMFGESMRFFWASRKALGHCGYSAGELFELSPWDLKPDYDRASFLRLLAPLLEGAKAVYFHTTHQRRDGVLIPVAATVRRHDDGDGGPVYMATVRELSPVAGDSEGRAALARQRMRLAAQPVGADVLGQLRRMPEILAVEAGKVRVGRPVGTADNLAYLSGWFSDTFC